MQPQDSGAPDKNDKEQSLTKHLLVSLFLRQLFFIAVMNVILLVTLFISIIFWAEYHVALAVQLVETSGMPSPEAQTWLKASELSIIPLSEPPEGDGFDWIPHLPESTEDGVRVFSFDSSYRVEFEEFAVVMDISGYYAMIAFLGQLIFVVELFFLFQNIFGNSRTIHRTLQPFRELAVTAVRLNSVENFTAQEMDTLAGELEKINATHLDSRISMTETQKELKTLAHAINAMLDRVSDAYNAQMRFVSDASHELRTPIAVIQGYSAMIDRWGKTDPEVLQESIDAIRGEAKNMELLMEQLLFLARGDNKSQTVSKEYVNLSSLAEKVLQEEEMIYPEHCILADWTREYMVLADPALIKQLLRILVDNSLKYTPTSGRIWLKLAYQGENVLVTIQDEGMGIAPDALPHIFKRFYRTDSSRTRQTGGTGLGLSIASWIATQHNAWFEVTSREEIGTKISFSLPLAEKEPLFDPEYFVVEDSV